MSCRHPQSAARPDCQLAAMKRTHNSPENFYVEEIGFMESLRFYFLNFYGNLNPDFVISQAHNKEKVRIPPPRQVENLEKFTIKSGEGLKKIGKKCDSENPDYETDFYIETFTPR